MIIGKPAPFVRAFVDAVDEAIRAQSPSHGMSAMQRTWLAFCVTAVLVTNSMCWARFERASLGTYALAALSWMFRHSKMPWDELLVARVRVILRHYGITSGSLVIDDTDNPRSKAAKALAHLSNLQDQGRGALWDRAFCRWRFGDVRGRAGDLADTQQSESPRAQARTARCRLLCYPSRYAPHHSHPWGRRGHRHRRQCQGVCRFPQ